MAFSEIPIKIDGDVEAGPSLMEAMSMGLEDSKGEENIQQVNGVVSYVMEHFNRSAKKRMVDEERWLECFRNFSGKYGPTTQFTDREKSRAFIKITKTKVQAAYAQITDVLFAGNKFPIGIQPPNISIAVDDAVNFDPQKPKAPEEQTSTPNPQMAPHIAKLFGPKKSILEPIKEKLESGVGLTPTAITYEPAKEAAKKMEQKIHDQLDEANASASLRNFVFDKCLYGTGVYKGPFALDKEYPKWNESGGYEPSLKTIPDLNHVSIWNAYPDADARSKDECENFIERHRMSRTQLRQLKKRPMFRSEAIEELIKEGPNYQPQHWEAELTEDNDAGTNERWEVLEFWGIIDADIAKESSIKIPKEYKDYDELQINAWISGGKVIRLVLNPFKPNRIPYYVVPYELNPYSIFGVGVAENMMDSQLLMNGFMRLAVDNAALSSNIIFEINEDYLVPGQDMEIYPGKVFRRSGGAPGQAINAQKIENVTQECLALFDKARQLSDESTGMPSYAHGMTDVMSTGKTAAGMSMLMGAAAQNIKAVVRNIDDYLLSPLGRDMYAFNMQFNFDKDFIGDVVVVAKGTESLMRNEVRSQKLLQLAQFAAGNPSMAPLIKWDYILREYATSLDLDEEKVVNDPRAAAIQASQMAALQATMTPPGQEGQPPQQQQNQQAQANGQVPGASMPGPEDPTGTGNGNIAPGAAPEPDAQGFSGSGPQPTQAA